MILKARCLVPYFSSYMCYPLDTSCPTISTALLRIFNYSILPNPSPQSFIPPSQTIWQTSKWDGTITSSNLTATKQNSSLLVLKPSHPLPRISPSSSMVIMLLPHLQYVTKTSLWNPPSPSNPTSAPSPTPHLWTANFNLLTPSGRPSTKPWGIRSS